MVGGPLIINEPRACLPSLKKTVLWSIVLEATMSLIDTQLHICFKLINRIIVVLRTLLYEEKVNIIFY